MSGECHQTENILCKHVRASKTMYVNLDDRLPQGVDLVSATADTDDADLDIIAVEVVASNTTVQDGDCTVYLVANRAILIKLEGGTVTDDDSETIVTVAWVQDDDDTDSIDCRLMIGGRAAT